MRTVVVPLVLTVLSLATVIGVAVVPRAAELPSMVLRQSGHWAVTGAASAVVHLDGATQQVDARVDLPVSVAADARTTLQGETLGYVVGSRDAYTFDKAGLMLGVSVPLPVSPDVPIGIEVVGGPYLVYRSLGTIVRLAVPPVVIDLGGPVSTPVRTSDGTVSVYRTDTGAVCAVHRGAMTADCSASVAPRTPVGLSVVDDRAAFVDADADAGAAIDDGDLGPRSWLATDLPVDTLLADQAAGGRLPMVVPGRNVLRLVDSSGISDGRIAGPPLDVPLGPGRFTAPVVSGRIVALLDLTTSRLLTFTTDGRKVAEVPVAPGTTAESLTRGEDGRLYLDDADKNRTRVVRRDGTIGTVDLGSGRTSRVSSAPRDGRLAPVDVQRVGTGPGNGTGGDPTAGTRRQDGPGRGNDPVSGGGGGGGGGGGLITPRDPGPFSRAPQPPEPQPLRPDPPPVVTPSAPTGVSAVATANGGVSVSWRAGTGGGTATSWMVAGSGAAGTRNSGTTSATFTGLAPGTYTFTVSGTNGAGAGPATVSNSVTVAAPGPGTVRTLTADRRNDSGSLHVLVSWEPPTTGTTSSYEVTVDGQIASGTHTVTSPTFDDNDRGSVGSSNYCSPAVTYTVRAVDAAGTRGDPESYTLRSSVDCTMPTVVQSATADPESSSVTVVVDCQGAGRSPFVSGPITLQFDGETEDSGSQSCQNSATGHDLHSYRITGLEPGRTYAVTARTTSPTGSKTSDPVPVTTSS